MMQAFLAILLFLVPVQEDDKSREKELEEQARTKVNECKAQLKEAKREVDVIVQAIQKLGAMQHKRILKELASLLTRYTPQIQKEVADQIVKYSRDPLAAEILLQRSENEKDGDLAAYFIEGVGKIGCKKSARALAAYFKMNKGEVEKSAVRASGELKSKDSIQPLIDLAEELERIPLPGRGGRGAGRGAGRGLPGRAGRDDERVKRRQDVLPLCLKALGQITGESHKNANDWQEWWNTNRKDFEEK